MRALLWPLFDRSAWAQPATVVAVTIVVDADVATVRSVGVGSASHYVGGATVHGAAQNSVRLLGLGSAIHCDGAHDWLGHCSGLCSLRRLGLSQQLWWRARQVRDLLCPMFTCSSWVQPATVVPGMTGQVASLASTRLVGESSASHSGGGHDR